MKTTKLNRITILIFCIALIISVSAGCGSAGKTSSSENDSNQTSSHDTAADQTSSAETAADKSSSSEKKDESLPPQEEEKTAEASSEETTDDAAYSGSSSENEPDAMPEDAKSSEEADAPEIPGLTCIGKMSPDYAVTFEIYYYEGGYSLIDVFGDARYLVIPENGSQPEELEKDIVCLPKPFKNIYMVATAVYSLFDSIQTLDRIRFTGTPKGGIYLEAVDEALDSGKMIYAGRYSAPDYETLIQEGCDLAIESTRIYHTPEIKEVLENLQIPVFVDRSSYETHPLGRTEWIRVYGELLDKKEEAEQYFAEQKKVIETLDGTESTGKKVLFFYMNTDGTAVIRRPEDYMVKMIEMAGGEYAFSHYKTSSTLSTISISMEEFYSIGKDADLIIYNASVNSPITSIQDLINMEPLFKDFKAVEEDLVWTTDKSLFQAANITSRFTMDLYEVLHNGDDGKLEFLTRVH